MACSAFRFDGWAKRRQSGINMVDAEIKSFLREVTQELLYNISFRYMTSNLTLFELCKEFKRKVGYHPQDLFGLGNITSDGLSDLIMASSPVSVGCKNVMVWKHYNSEDILATNSVGRSIKTIAEYREMLLVKACDLMVQEDGSVNVNCANKYGNTPLHIISALPCSCDDHLNLIRYLINAGANALSENDEGLNILHIIAGRIQVEEFTTVALNSLKFVRGRIYARSWECGHRQDILSFLSQKISPVNLAYLMGRPGRDGNTAMHEWVMSTDCTEATPKPKVHREFGEQRILIKEIEFGYELLYAGGNLKTMNKSGLLPIHYAFCSEVFKFLVDQGAVCCARSYHGETSFLFILKHLLLSLLAWCDCPPNISKEIKGCLGDPGMAIPIFRDKDQDDRQVRSMMADRVVLSLKQLAQNKEFLETALISDIEAVSSLEVVLVFIRIVAYIPGYYNSVPAGDLQRFLVKFLAQIATTCNPSTLSNSNNKGQSLLHVLLDMGLCVNEVHFHLYLIASIVESLATLLHHGADVNAVDAEGRTALHLSCLQYARCPSLFGECAQVLVKYDARMDLKDSFGRTVHDLLSNNEELQSICVQTKRKVHCVSQRHRKSALQIAASPSSNVKVVGKYRHSSESVIASGAFGCVYVAIKDEREDKNSKMIDCRTFALKRLDRERINPKEIKREVDVLLAISSQCENIVAYHDTIEEESFYYIALELMEGDLRWFVKDSDMKEKVDQDPAIKVEATLDIIKGLTFLHQNKFLHRDLKPGNILYTLLHTDPRHPSLRFKIADFGLAKNISTLHSFTSTSGAVVPGTRCWMAPELVSRESQEHTTESDVFALGLVLHYLLSLGSHPFVDATKEQPPHVVETNIVEMKVSFHESLSCEARHFIEEILAKSPEQRPAANVLEQHPFLWSEKKKNEFLIAVGNEEEAASPKKHPNSALEQCLQNTDVGREVSVIPWDARVPDVYLDMITAFKRRGYRTNCVIELLRFLRNAYFHKQERRANVIGQLEGNIFLKKFPSLVLDVCLALENGGFFRRTSIRQALS